MREDRRPFDRGDSLIEILAAVTVLSIGVVGLLTALVTQVTTTTDNRAQAQVNTALLAAAEMVKSASIPTTFPASDCWPATSVDVTDSLELPEGFSATYGEAYALESPSTPCSVLAVVPVQVNGGGFSRSLEVVRRR